MAAPGTIKGVMRSLKHLQPPTKGSKFAVKAPSHAAHKPKFVQVKDRVPYWNIVLGDHVRLRTGRVGQKQGLDNQEGEKIRGEGIVLSIDREKNWVWLRDVDENNQLAPKAVRHIVPRYVDPDDPSKGFGPNVTEIPRPVHYSNLMLKIPGSDQYAVRLSRSHVRFNKRKGMFVWKRFATIRVADDKVSETGRAFEKVEVPWPKLPGKKRMRNAYTSDSFEVESESWAPWRPEDPVCLPSPRQRTSKQSEIRAAIQQAQRGQFEQIKSKRPGLAVPVGALGTYAGFEPSRAKPAPIAQPPTPAETIRAQRAEVAEWATAAEIEAHRKEGGLAFASSDYLDIAPRYGPANGGDWADLPHTTPEGGLDGIRDAKTGRLLKGVNRNDVDRMPIELLMKNELANESGLKWRMRRWKQKQVESKATTAEMNRERKDLLEELSALKL